MCLMALGVMAQAVEWQWYNPMDAGFPTVQNQAYGDEIDSRLFILDCLPNLDTEKEADVEMLLRNAIEQLRKKGDIPILLVDHIGFSNIATDSVKKN